MESFSLLPVGRFVIGSCLGMGLPALFTEVDL